MAAGKEIFHELEQYPLRKETGVKDYIFYFVSASDKGFGEAAHRFFKKFYEDKGYVGKDVSSLEEMIGALYAEVKRGVKRIREIVIVAHATPQGLVPPIFTSASASNLPEYRHITEKTLSFLWKDFHDNKFATFRQQRAAVVAHLFDDSWVTIRACRVGASQVCMYAYYAFFGGRANVYAPKEYMFFGQVFLLPGSRFENKQQLHAHLVKQHFLRNDEQTPHGKAAIIEEIIDPALYSSPVELASKLTTSSTQDAADYDELVRNLDARKPSLALWAALTLFPPDLSSKANINIRVESKGQRWTVIGTETKPDGTFRVRYEITQEAVSGGFALMESATVLVTKYAEKFPFQLFFHQTEDDRFTGKLVIDGKPFRLAAYVDGKGADAVEKQKFDAVVALLNSNRYSDGTVNLQTLFKEGPDITLPEQPNITLMTPALAGANARLIWSIGGTPSYLVKQELPVAYDGSQAHTLTVYMDAQALAQEQEHVKTISGLDPDTPGTELPNYLDQFSLDELADFIDYLRAPYRASNAYYIRHAQNAINRKRGSEQWEKARLGPDFTNVPVPRRPYTELSLSESDDLRTVAYDFGFNNIWQEVKQSFPVPPIFQNDLFEEDDLWARLHESEQMPDRDALDEIAAESPYQDLETLRKIESQELDKFFSVTKETYEPQPPQKPTCDEFKAIVQKWKELQGQPAESIREQLSAIITPEGKSFYDYLWEAFEWYERVNTPLEFLELAEMAKSIPKLIVENVAILEESVAANVIADVLFPLTGIFMWLEFAVEQQEAVEAWERKGKLVAVRQWLEELEFLARHGPVPDEPAIDLGDDYLARYAAELHVNRNSPEAFIPYPPEFQKGFEEGKEAMERVGKDIVKRADETSAKALAKLNFTPCEIQVLKDAGVFDVEAIRSQTVAAIARLILGKLPHA
jgi:hypothetical protein